MEVKLTWFIFHMEVRLTWFTFHMEVRLTWFTFHMEVKLQHCLSTAACMCFVVLFNLLLCFGVRCLM